MIWDIPSNNLLVFSFFDNSLIQKDTPQYRKVLRGIFVIKTTYTTFLKRVADLSPRCGVNKLDSDNRQILVFVLPISGFKRLIFVLNFTTSVLESTTSVLEATTSVLDFMAPILGLTPLFCR